MITLVAISSSSVCMLLPSPIKIVAWSLRVDQRLFAIPFAFMLTSLVATQFADIMYFSVRIFFSSIISIFFNKVWRQALGVYLIPGTGYAIRSR